jgi:hypothetical protein
MVAEAPIVVRMPRPHRGQQAIIDAAQRVNVVMCGRRFGKTALAVNRVCVSALQGNPTAYFVPGYANARLIYEQCVSMLAPAIRRARAIARSIELHGGGVIDFWSLENPDAGRGRMYAEVAIDEAGFARNLRICWQQAIRPTLTDLRGTAWILGTPRAVRYFVEMFEQAKQRDGWAAFSAKSVDNPTIPHDDIEQAKRELPAEIFAQEYEGIPCEGGGNPFGLDSIEACIREPAGQDTICYGIDLARKRDWTVVVGISADGQVTELHRWQSDWGETVERIARVIGANAALVDATGVGDPIVQALQQRGLAVQPFVFSSPSKQALMSRLAMSIQRNEVSFPDGVLVDELKTFGYEATRTGVVYSAPSGMHDDCVCALALAVHHWHHSHLHAPEARWI